MEQPLTAKVSLAVGSFHAWADGCLSHFVVMYLSFGQQRWGKINVTVDVPGQHFRCYSTVHNSLFLDTFTCVAFNECCAILQGDIVILCLCCNCSSQSMDSSILSFQQLCQTQFPWHFWMTFNKEELMSSKRACLQWIAPRSSRLSLQHSKMHICFFTSLLHEATEGNIQRLHGSLENARCNFGYNLLLVMRTISNVLAADCLHHLLRAANSDEFSTKIVT